MSMSTQLPLAQPPLLNSASLSSHLTKHPAASLLGQLLNPNGNNLKLFRRSSLVCPWRLRSIHVDTATGLQAKALASTDKSDETAGLPKSTLRAFHVGAILLSTVEQPTLAVTGVNNEEDLTWALTQLAIVAFWYFLIMPPIILNWLRTRMYRKNLPEMFVQYMSVFLFFPGVMLWAPFLNFRKFPRDPSLKYPWSEPEDPSQVKNARLKYPFAQPEDYE